jgi:hypothetical protein
MRLRQILLLPALGALAASAAVDTDDKQVARAAAAFSNAIPNPSPAPQAPGSKGTKDAPVDGFDGKPHAGPYVDDKPTSSGKQPAIVEDVGTKHTPLSKPKDSTLVDGAAAVLDGDKSVMQDPDRKLATGNTGVEGGVSAKDKERLEDEGKTGPKQGKVPESPKEAPPLPHGEQKHIEDALQAIASTTSRVYGAAGLEVSCHQIPTASCPLTIFVETHRPP